MKTKVILYADEGKVLTDGESYGTTIYLGDGRSMEEFHEITQEEYERILKEEEEKDAVN